MSMYSAPALPTVRSVVDPATLRNVKDPRQQALDTINAGQQDALSQAIALRQAKNQKAAQTALQEQYARIRTAAAQAEAAAMKAAQDYQNQQTAGYSGTSGATSGSASGQSGYVAPVSYKPGATAGGNTALWGDPRSRGWAAKNLVTFKGGKFNVTVNRAASAAFQGFLHALTSKGYKIGTLYSYNLRNKRTNDTLSEHAYGTAIDINPAQNPAGYHGEFKSNMPTWVGALAARYGLIWGGYWHKTPDPMHFEYVAPSKRR